MARTKRTELPDDLHLIEAITAAVASAREKHRAAAALVATGGSWPSAFTLAALGFEELGKANLCLSVIMMRDIPDIETFVPEFWNAFNGPGAHRAKSEAAHFLLRMFGSSLPLPVYEQVTREVSEAAEATNAKKFRAIYVDFAADDDAVLPPTDVTEQEAREMTDMLGSAISLIDERHVLPTAEDIDASELADYFRQARSGMDFAAITKAIGDDPVKLIEFTEQIRTPILTNADTPPEILRKFFPNLPFGDDAGAAA